jgi:hypothetical protein
MDVDGDGYLRFLVERDGDPDLGRRTLTRREAFFAALSAEPLHATTPVDRAAYLRNLDRRRLEGGLDARVLWLLATAQANQAERFGVGLAELYGVITPESDRVRLHVTLQEVYHTRILADVLALFGLPMRHRPPGIGTRAVTHLMVRTPERWHLPLVGAGEMVGCVLFETLRDRGLELFARDTEVAARIRLLFDEILGDELGHVGFVAASLGPLGRATMRRLYRMFAVPLASGAPAMAALLGRHELRRRLRAVFRPSRMAAGLPGLAYVAADP